MVISFPNPAHSSQKGYCEHMLSSVHGARSRVPPPVHYFANRADIDARNRRADVRYSDEKPSGASCSSKQDSGGLNWPARQGQVLALAVLRTNMDAPPEGSEVDSIHAQYWRLLPSKYTKLFRHEYCFIWSVSQRVTRYLCLDQGWRVATAWSTLKRRLSAWTETSREPTWAPCLTKGTNTKGEIR